MISNWSYNYNNIESVYGVRFTDFIGSGHFVNKPSLNAKSCE